MNTLQHGHLYQLTRFLGAFNCYLVREDDGFTLIDTNLPGSAPGILQAAQQLGQPIRRIVLTHAHNDHVASLDALVAALPGVEVIASEREAPILEGDLRLKPGEPQAKLRGGYTQPQTKPSRLAVGHGGVLSNPVAALGTAIAVAEKQANFQAKPGVAA
ncbi:MAG: MBL fold metallo-hydrolase [Anaerolineae bacterium]|nr:MBL fold metallo-hydrolase [Anaerolineae bacterium]